MRTLPHRPALAILASFLAVACGETTLPTSGTLPDGTGKPLLTPASGTTPTPLANGVVGPFHIMNNYGGHTVVLQSPDDSRIRASMQKFAPGGTSGWHTHAGPVIVVVTAGVLTSYDTDCEKHEFPAGTAFIEYGGRKDVHVSRNEQAVDLEFLAMQITGVDAPARIDAPQPAGCPF